MTIESFIIDGTDFGIEIDESAFEIDVSNPEKPRLSIGILGNSARFDKLSEDEDSKWFFALSAPHFYLNDFPATATGKASRFKATASLDDIGEYDLAIYMMEHNDIDDVKIEVRENHSLHITGRVDLFGETCEFAIHWRKS